MQNVILPVSLNRLNEYLHDIDIQAKEAVNRITAELAKSRGIDKHLKVQDQLRRVAEINNCTVAAEEIVLGEIVYAQKQSRRKPFDFRRLSLSYFYAENTERGFYHGNT